MTDPQGGPDRVPPTSTSQHYPPQGHAYGVPPPPPGYAVAYAPPRPQQLGLASAMTIVVGVLGVLGGLAVLIGAVFVNFAFGVAGSYSAPWSGAPDMLGRTLVGVMFILALVPLVFGIMGISAGAGLGSGRRSAWSSAMVVHVVSLVFAAVTLLAGGLALLWAIPSGIALWALHQPEVKAYFGRS